jgi:hypothetical protein
MSENIESLCITGMSQHQINKFLIWGIVFSLFWIWGIGSFISVIMGLRARKAIKESGGACRGSIRVWWCLVFGGLGVAWTTYLVVLAYIKSFNA